VIDFAQLPAVCQTRVAGLLLAVPELVALDLTAILTAAGHPHTRVIPAVSSILSLLALKLTPPGESPMLTTWPPTQARGVFAGLVALPKTPR
jgi:hypothetical protein